MCVCVCVCVCEIRDRLDGKYLRVMFIALQTARDDIWLRNTTLQNTHTHTHARTHTHTDMIGKYTVIPVPVSGTRPAGGVRLNSQSSAARLLRDGI